MDVCYMQCPFSLEQSAVLAAVTAALFVNSDETLPKHLLLLRMTACSLSRLPSAPMYGSKNAVDVYDFVWATSMLYTGWTGLDDHSSSSSSSSSSSFSSS